MAAEVGHGSSTPRTCPLCGLVVAFSEADDGTQPTCNPLRSPSCWNVTARLTKQGKKPLDRDGRAALREVRGV